MCEAAAVIPRPYVSLHLTYVSSVFMHYVFNLFVFICVLYAGWHEELDRKLSQNSLGEMAKLGSKTTLNRRVSPPESFLHHVNAIVLSPS